MCLLCPHFQPRKELPWLKIGRKVIQQVSTRERRAPAIPKRSYVRSRGSQGQSGGDSGDPDHLTRRHNAGFIPVPCKSESLVCSAAPDFRIQSNSGTQVIFFRDTDSQKRLKSYLLSYESLAEAL